jgi:protein-S-isoprenylcysteine O-methyltransferase Ste14
VKAVDDGAAAFAERRFRLRWALSTSVVAGFWFAFFAAHLKAWFVHQRPVGLGTVMLECVFAVLFVIRRRPLIVSRSAVAWAAAAIGSFGMLAARPDYARAGSDWPAQLLQLVGSAAAIYCLARLGRSFGIIAAHRGLRLHGPYRIIRHPIYACYLIVIVGYLLENPTIRNLVVVCCVVCAQVLRIREEERCLSTDPAYDRYRRHVRHRLIPHLY